MFESLLGPIASTVGKKALFPAIGAGIGFTSQGIKDKWFDGGDEVTGSDYLASGLLGALTGGGGSIGRGATAGLTKVGLPWAGKIGGSVGMAARGGGLLGMIGSLLDHDKPDGGPNVPVVSGAGIGMGPMPGIGAGGMGNDIFGGGIYGSLGDAPSFNKTLADYMGDPTLNSLADAQIIKANAALARENKDTRIQMGRDTAANSDAGQTAINQIGQIRRENVSQNNAIQDNAEASQHRTVDEANRLAEDVGASILSDDHTRHDVQAEQARHAQDIAARQAADSKLLERMATASQDALGTLAGAEAMATKSNADSIRVKAMDAVRSNRAQAADNWLERPNILGSLADTSMQRDLQAHQMALQGWGARLDALNTYRQGQLEQQKAQGGGMDPSMLNSLLSLATTPTGITYEMVGEDGMKTKYAPRLYDQNPALQQSLNQIYGALGIPQAFTSTPVPNFGG